MPVKVDFYGAVLITRIALATQRTAGTVLRLIAGKGLFIAAMIGLDSFFYLFHAFASRAAISVGNRVIDKLVGCIQLLLIAFLMTLVPVELIVLYIGGNTFFFQPLIVLFTAVASVSCHIIGLLTVVAEVFLEVRNQRFGISRILVKAVRGDKLIVGADLNIVTGLQLPVSHVILFHAHKRCVPVSFAVAVAVGSQRLLLLLVFIQRCRPVLARIAQLLTNLIIYLFVL